MTNKDLANLIFPNITKTIEDYEEIYPARNLGDGVKVTRFAPSPTGYMHIGGIYQAIINYVLAHHSNGVFYLRNEDTDGAREVKDAAKLIMHTLKSYNLTPDEYEFEGETKGNYGPYIQSERKEIYHTFIKHLIEIGRAYPCFCTREELDAMRHEQEAKKDRQGYYKEYAKCRNLTVEEAYNKIKNGEPYVIRFRSNGDFDTKLEFNDLVKGKVELPQNDQDIVIMKSDNKLPTYHFAHVVDDHLMHTTHVVRGEEWLPSVPIHIELFRAFGYKHPKYIHTPLIMKKEGERIRKISKRKDPEASMSYYEEKGYPTYAVIESLMTISNSNYESWHTANPDKTFLDFNFTPSKMSSSGALYDLEKLENISKNYISRLKAEEVYVQVLAWASKFDLELYDLMMKYKEYTTAIFNIEREQKKPRKDYSCYSEIKNQIWYMYDELFNKNEDFYEFNTVTDIDEIEKICSTYLKDYYQEDDSKEEWFDKIKSLAEQFGYAREVKEYKENPEQYKGHVGDVSTVLRVALTKKSMTPDLYEIMRLLGPARMQERIEKVIKKA